MLSTEKTLFDWNQTFTAPIWHLENRTEKKMWLNSFKKLLQKLFKLNLQCFMLSREKPFFEWMQTFRAPNLASRESKRFKLNFQCVYFRDRSKFLTETNLQSSCAEKIWHMQLNKELGSKTVKSNLQIVMLSRDKSLFEWNQTFRVWIWHLESRMDNSFQTVLPKSI